MAVIINGTPGNDELAGTAADDIIDGADGDDIIREALGGNDVIAGGRGNDEILVSRPAGLTYIDGGEGDDAITVILGRNPTGSFTITGGAGADVLSISGMVAGNIDGGDGDDAISIIESMAFFGASTRASVTLGAGKDILYVPAPYWPPDRLPLSPVTRVVNDFQVGASGDVLLTAGILAQSGSDVVATYNGFIHSG